MRLFFHSLALLCLLAPLSSPQIARAEDSRPVLRWAADSSSGAPFIFVDPDEPTRLVGFEKDIIEKLAEKMGRRLVFVQNEWDSLIPGLERGDYDIAANGIEITPERSQQVLFSQPYYATFEQVVVRADENRIRNFETLGTYRVGTLKSSLAHYILEKQSPQSEIVFYDDENVGYRDVENGRVDAFFIDYPIALFYAYPNPKLKPVGNPVGHMEYGIAISKKNPKLALEINHALQQLRASSELEYILAKWNLLHPYTIQSLALKNPLANSETEYNRIATVQSKEITWTERFERYHDLMPLLLKGAWMTMEISIASMILAIISGLTLALMRLYGTGIMSGSAQVFIEIVRGTPLLIQLYLIFFGLPYVGIHLSPFWAAVIGLGLNYGAYEAENYRAGIQAVPSAQTEAAQALALSPFQRFTYVIFPQAYRIILPPMTNDFISLIKDSSLVSVITMVELTTTYSQLASTYFDHLGLGLLVAAMYFALGYPFVRIARRLEKRIQRKQTTV